MHRETESCLQVNGSRSAFFPVRTGVRQGCSVAPRLFKCIIDHVMTCTTRKLSFELKQWDRVATDRFFADDIALSTNFKSQLLIVLNTTLGEAARTGLFINWKNTKGMVVLPKSETDNSNYLVARHQIEVVNHFNYFGSIIS